MDKLILNETGEVGPSSFKCITMRILQAQTTSDDCRSGQSNRLDKLLSGE